MFSGQATPNSILPKERNVCLVNGFWGGRGIFGARNVFWRRKIDLPMGSAYQPFFESLSETFAAIASFFMEAMPF